MKMTVLFNNASAIDLAPGIPILLSYKSNVINVYEKNPYKTNENEE